MGMKALLSRALSTRQKTKLKALLARASSMQSDDLNAWATIHGTDKWNYHWYTQHYQRHFHSLRKNRLKILEIGVGGHADPRSGGNSLRMWKDYFPNSMIYGIDIHDKSTLEEKRIRIFRGDQTDEQFLNEVVRKTGPLDIVIDDGSHENAHVLATFRVLFPLLSDNGIYAIEDVENSYWPESGGDSENLNNPATTMGFCKSLVDSLNFEEIIRPGYQPTYFDRHIVAAHFYHNLVLVYKGDNREGSRYLLNNARRSSHWLERAAK